MLLLQSYILSHNTLEMLSHSLEYFSCIVGQGILKDNDCEVQQFSSLSCNIIRISGHNLRKENVISVRADGGPHSPSAHA